MIVSPLSRRRERGKAKIFQAAGSPKAVRKCLSETVLKLLSQNQDLVGVGARLPAIWRIIAGKASSHNQWIGFYSTLAILEF
jgi:hypothetical protein